MKRSGRVSFPEWLSLSVIMALLGLFMAAGFQPSLAQDLAPGDGTTPPGPVFAPDQLLLRFRPWVPGHRADQILAERGVARMRRIEALDVEVLRLPPGLSVQQAVDVLGRLPEVEFAEPNYILRALALAEAEVADQWGLQMIQAPAAWGEMPGQTPALLAVVDTGVDRTHDDLAANIWTNPGEIADNDLDDDENGFVDDTWGWDFANNDNDPLDDHMHGTAVSSVAAGVQDGVGVAGVCPWCQVVAVKVLGPDGSGTLDTVAEGIVYAADIGARVINLSLGAAAGSTTMENAVDDAWSKGALVVAAAGNDGEELLFYPAAYDRAMAIASTNDQDSRSCFSNYSEGFITVAAPGEEIQAAVPNQGYETHSGTSLSAPHVTGLGGLLFSQDPDRTNADVWTLIETTAEDLAPVGTDAYFGTGRINAYRAVIGDDTPTDPPPGLFCNDLTASGYAHARKLARDPFGTLHWVRHDRQGAQYQVLYATSGDDGQTWTQPEVVFASSAETYHPALAIDRSNLYIVFPSMEGSASFRTFFTWKPLAGGEWLTPTVPLLGGAYDAVRPDLHAGPSEGELHLVASSFDNAPNVYYIRSDDGGASWGDPKEISVEYNSRYADVYASGSGVYIAGRTVEFTFFGLLPRYRLFTTSSTDGGDNWGNPTELEAYDGWVSGEYGVSLAGVGDRLYLGYEHSGGIRFRQSDDGVTWSNADDLGSGAWPSITQANDGRAWLLWERGDNLVLRRFTGAAWEAEEVLGLGNYPNLKLGVTGNLVEWVATHCSGAPFRLTYGSQASGDPTVVQLASFTATPRHQSILLEWVTTVEVGNRGFNLYRAESLEGSQTKLNTSLIPSQAPGSLEGQSYQFVDETASRGVTTYYWLEAVDIYDAATRHGPVSATLAGVRLYLPLVVRRSS